MKNGGGLFTPANIQHSNDILRDAARDMVGSFNPEFTCFSNDSTAYRYLSGRAQCTDSDLDRLASLSSQVGCISANAQDLAFLDETISAGTNVSGHCLWWSSLCQLCLREEKKSCVECVFLGVVFAIVALLFGSTFYTMVQVARRVSALSKRLLEIHQSKLWLKNQIPAHSNHPGSVARKIASIMSLEASNEMEQALQACRRHTVIVLVLSIIASLSLVLLATAVILALCIGPGTPVIMTAILIGVSATGGGGLAVSIIALIIARYCERRHVREYARSVQQAGYLAALSERILRQCTASNLRSSHVRNCTACFLTKYPAFFSKREKAFLEDLLNSGYRRHYSHKVLLDRKSTRF